MSLVSARPTATMRQITGRKSEVMVSVQRLALNVSKTKELVADLRKQGGDHNSVLNNRAAVEMVNSLRFLGISTLTWPLHIDTVIKKVHVLLLSEASGKIWHVHIDSPKRSTDVL